MKEEREGVEKEEREVINEYGRISFYKKVA